ncbi:hypothetical protein GW765_01965 [Candidatus Parcubacteria bacterium]|uniref:Uncharacterized protein n=1 Tax=Candidatus Magasanikbacteria bacterium CG10_big_fil_rev_8_21_14_0_10_38_6 TaxID=1974647 RepID=A0A2M6P228_9BACT|nr:hypothetical protein [Candidatus Parcubacteria bacterium]PIR77751.1 MAG: hypothetical protein COU30_00705 [Candidatus Magasanikbacteria bacterium CG10_big_fil_rev_8_21_14_0_10_38_6]
MDNHNKRISRADRLLFQQEIHREVEKGTEKEKEFNEMVQKMDLLIRKYFPDAYANFSPPSFEYMERHYNIVIGVATGFEDEVIIDDSNAFTFVSAVRYIDNFIDEALWPILEEKNNTHSLQEGFEEKFYAFIDEVYKEVQVYDIYLPEEVVDLPKIEIKMFLNPDQETLDNLLEKYIDNKSFNLAYIDHLVTKRRPAEMSVWDDAEKCKYRLMALWDISRDVSDWADSTDFDLFYHIYSNNLDPENLKKIIFEVIKQVSPSLFDVVSKPRAKERETYYSMAQEAMEKDDVSQKEQFLLNGCLSILKFIDESSQFEFDAVA